MHIEPPPGTVAVEWVGMKSPLSDLKLWIAVAEDRLPPGVGETVREMARRAISRVDGHTRRILRRGNGLGQLPQLSRDWVWGPNAGAAAGAPGSYIQFLPYRDADAVKSSASGREFVIHGERDGGAGGLILPAGVDPTLVADAAGAEVFPSLAAFRRVVAE